MSQLSSPLVGGWLADAKNELFMYCTQMSNTHWGIVAGSCVVFGFLCLKSTGVNR